MELDEFPHVKHWFDSIYGRSATRRAYRLAPQYNDKAIQLLSPKGRSWP